MEMLVNKTALNSEYYIFPDGKKKWKKEMENSGTMKTEKKGEHNPLPFLLILV